MRPRNDTVYLRHILDAITWIETYTAGFDQSRFLSSNLVQDAVIRQIEIIGEASKTLSAEVRESNPGVPWSDIVGMRNILAHDYIGVELESVWLTIQKDLPTLKAKVSAALNALGEKP